MPAVAFLVTLTEPKTGERITFTATPERLPSDESVRENEWALLRGGLIRHPKEGGETPRTHTLAGFFPGGEDYGEPWAPVETWRPPRDLAFQLRAWMRAGTELRLLATDTDIDANVYIASFSDSWGDRDRLEFTIALTELRALWVDAIASSDAQQEAGGSAAEVAGGTRIAGSAVRPGWRANLAFRQQRAGEPPAPLSDIWTVRQGEGLAVIAATAYGDSHRWVELAAANADVLRAAGVDPGSTNLPGGLRLVVPGGTNTQPGRPSAPQQPSEVGAQ